MKSVLVVVFAVCALAAALPRPAQDEDSKEESPRDAEFFIVPLERSQPRQPSIFDFPHEFAHPAFDQQSFFRTPWGVDPHARDEQDDQVDDFMSQMQQMLKEMRKQLTELLQRQHPDAFPEGDTSVGTRIGEDDLPKNKSTSTTKVIEGHVVTVNETTYTSGDDNIGAVFRIKVVEVKPSEIPEGETEDADKPSESEDKLGEPSTASPHAEHEPTTSKSELEEDKHEETNEIPNAKEWRLAALVDPSLNEVEIDEPEYVVEEFKPVDSRRESYYDLSGDTRVNDYLSAKSQSQGLVMIEPDAEIIDPNTDLYYRYNYDRAPQRRQAFP